MITEEDVYYILVYYENDHILFIYTVVCTAIDMF